MSFFPSQPGLLALRDPISRIVIGAGSDAVDSSEQDSDLRLSSHRYEGGAAILDRFPAKRAENEAE